MPCSSVSYARVRGAGCPASVSGQRFWTPGSRVSFLGITDSCHPPPLGAGRKAFHPKNCPWWRACERLSLVLSRQYTNSQRPRLGRRAARTPPGTPSLQGKACGGRRAGPGLQRPWGVWPSSSAAEPHGEPRVLRGQAPGLTEHR